MADVINRAICIRQGAEFREEFRRVKARYVFKAAIAGTSGASAPVWPTELDASVLDGTSLTWVNQGLWDENIYPEVDVWLPSFAYALRAKVVMPIEAVDLTGYTGAFQLRESVDSATILYSGVTEFGVFADGEFAMVIPTADTALLTLDEMVYDHELSTVLGEVDFVVRGPASLTKEVTRP